MIQVEFYGILLQNQRGRNIWFFALFAFCETQASQMLVKYLKYLCDRKQEAGTGETYLCGDQWTSEQQL